MSTYTWVRSICSRCRVSTTVRTPWSHSNTVCSPRNRMRSMYGFSVIDDEAIDALLLIIQPTSEGGSLDCLVSGDIYQYTTV